MNGCVVVLDLEEATICIKNMQTSIVQFLKISIPFYLPPPPSLGRSLEISKGWGAANNNIFKGKYETKLEFPEGWEGFKPKIFSGGSVDIFWHNTWIYLALFYYQKTENGCFLFTLNRNLQLQFKNRNWQTADWLAIYIVLRYRAIKEFKSQLLGQTNLAIGRVGDFHWRPLDCKFSALSHIANCHLKKRTSPLKHTNFLLISFA